MLKFLSIAALLVTATAANAQDASPAPNLRVSYADLDLTRAAGRATFAGRIRRVVSELCHSQQQHRALVDQMASHRCERETTLRARELASLAIARAHGRSGAEQLAAR